MIYTSCRDGWDVQPEGFCYLLAPPLELVNADARRRLKAIEDFSGLGSGFNIAMQDLDIRGAGNILGRAIRFYCRSGVRDLSKNSERGVSGIEG